MDEWQVSAVMRLLQGATTLVSTVCGGAQLCHVEVWLASGIPYYVTLLL